MIDLHNHSEFSFDSKTPIEENIQAAINKNLKYIAVTDHMDLIKVTDNYEDGIDIPGYFEKVKILKEKYKDKIKVLYGIEVGIQYETAKKNDEITSQFDFDFIIGSIHSLKEQDIVLDRLFYKYPPRDLYKLYYTEMLKAVESTKNFDVLGHIDYIDRYAPSNKTIPNIIEYKDIIEEILKYLIKNNKGIEVNTAGIRAGLSYMHPKKEVLKWYRELGGEIITIGSDAHRKEDIGEGVFEACEMLKELGFKGVYVFEKRVPKKIEF
ncbi:histidinol-phosphatase HisJ family protein [Miniphocaeibacter halophilus]|uniref:Histidinol-phosphatase HisJ family protein n=1 Tax=Miniphocaeibacter halophilus TaxID=2931922 RepID=A0AC61MRR3_9FIRM|nr:histidinol-phosphatase HisJ family protein [Miniphocaeibacter halophilus]QQK08181.1 histidinol-phosphatase HisJ family protein [Miniphocaeibacter halophilus]